MLTALSAQSSPADKQPSEISTRSTLEEAFDLFEIVMTTRINAVSGPRAREPQIMGILGTFYILFDTDAKKAEREMAGLRGESAKTADAIDDSVKGARHLAPAIDKAADGAGKLGHIPQRDRASRRGWPRGGRLCAQRRATGHRRGSRPPDRRSGAHPSRRAGF